MSDVAISAADVRTAASQLAQMRGSLSSWLKYRGLNDRVLAGTLQTNKPAAYAQGVIASTRDPALERNLAVQLNALLSRVMPGYPLPSVDAPNAAVQLAQLALQGGTTVSSPAATGSLLGGGHPWLWPVLIVAGLLLVVTSAIKTSADAATERERIACIEAGACTDYGFWLKAGAIGVAAWLLWTHLGGKEAAGAVKRHLNSKGKS
jgi:hypothetical protein